MRSKKTKKTREIVLFHKVAGRLYCLIYKRKCGFRYVYIVGSDYNERYCKGEAVAIFPDRKMSKILRRIADREEEMRKKDGYTARYTFIDET